MTMATTTPKHDSSSQSFEKARDAGSQALDKTRSAAGSVGEMVGSAATAVGQKADDLTQAAGSGIKGLGETMAKNTPHEGMLGSAAQTVASGIKETGKYLEEEGLSGMSEDVTNLIRRNPVPAVLIGIGIGFLLGRTLGSS